MSYDISENQARRVAADLFEDQAVKADEAGDFLESEINAGIARQYLNMALPIARALTMTFLWTPIKAISYVILRPKGQSQVAVEYKDPHSN